MQSFRKRHFPLPLTPVPLTTAHTFQRYIVHHAHFTMLIRRFLPILALFAQRVCQPRTTVNSHEPVPSLDISIVPTT